MQWIPAAGLMSLLPALAEMWSKWKPAEGPMSLPQLLA
jgi:hypothetical protein